ncbi:hypothetical protein llap_7136 [Limosa lapponica baueri]|uniref:Uncharacterized protein n=1 Tax=Limosa lapponica baueri TaxID=1758121 RepID=A0A2I0U927_LIMLA|nr:hypothetical protein llap_7136 [Limosa lapponica baueri]
METEVKSLWAATQVSIKDVEKEEEESATQHAERELVFDWSDLKRLLTLSLVTLEGIGRMVLTLLQLLLLFVRLIEIRSTKVATGEAKHISEITQVLHPWKIRKYSTPKPSVSPPKPLQERTRSFAAVRRMLNQLPEPDTALKLSTKGLKVLFDLSMARDLIAASARYDLIFDEQIFKMA